MALVGAIAPIEVRFTCNLEFEFPLLQRRVRLRIEVLTDVEGTTDDLARSDALA
jgi:hypothetical protein